MKKRTFLKMIIAFLPGLAAAGKLKPTPFVAPPSSPEPVRHELDRFYIAGLQYHEGAERRDFRVDDAVRLVREPSNYFDARAVRVEWRGMQIGYVPRNQNRILSRMLDRQAPLAARICKINPEEPTWHRVKVRVDIVEERS